MKKTMLILTLALVLILSGCSQANEKDVEIVVFGAASMTETLTTVVENYRAVAPHVNVVLTFDSSGTLKTQIENGADCQVFVSAGQKQMDALMDDFVAPDTRINLLENKVTLVVPEGNPNNVTSFDELAKRLKDGDVMFGMGNADVPVGQYTQKILAFYELDEAAIASNISYGTNVKEVTSQVAEAAVDCGVVYATDAHSAGLTVVDTATPEMCGQIIYPAALIKTEDADKAEAAAAFLAYLQTADAQKVFESVGFSPVQ